MSPARLLPADPPFITDGRNHPERSSVRLSEPREPSLDFSEACEAEHTTGLLELEEESLGAVLDLDASLDCFGPLDDAEPDTLRFPIDWIRLATS